MEDCLEIRTRAGCIFRALIPSKLCEQRPTLLWHQWAYSIGRCASVVSTHTESGISLIELKTPPLSAEDASATERQKLVEVAIKTDT
jgi:hypothetical protein